MEANEENDVQKRYLISCLLALRNADSDTEKFAALLMVAKVIKAQDCAASEKRQILEAVGFPFLVRLLKTKAVPEGCSPLVFKSVAVSVLSAVIEDPVMASDKQMSLVLPYMKEIFEMVLNKKNEEERELLYDMMKDIYSILSKMSCTPEGGKMLMDVEFQQTLVQTLDGQLDEGTVVMAHTLLVLLQCQCGSLVWKESRSSFDQYVRVLGQRIAECEDKSLFSLCELMTYILNYMPERRRDEASALAVKPLVEKLSKVIRSKIGVAERQTALAMVNQLVVCVGVECLLPPVFPDHKIFLLVLSLTCIDIRLAVENGTEEQMHKSASTLCLHYNALETMLNFLCQHDESQALPLPADMFCQAHDALLGAANGVFYFLQQVDSGSLVFSEMDPLTVASVRMVAAFTSQAFDEVKENVLDVLPFLLKLCQTEVGPVRGLTPKNAIMEKKEDVGLGDKNVGHGADPPAADSVTDTDGPPALHDQHSCTHVSDTLTKLNITPDSREQSSNSPSPTDDREGKSADLQDSCQMHPSQNTTATCKDDVTKMTGLSAKAATSTSGENAEEVSQHRNTDLVSHSVHHESDAQHRGKESGAVSARTGEGDGGGVTLPTTLEELTRWICRSSGGTSVQLPSLEVMKFLLPVFQLVCEDEETRRRFTQLRGHAVLIQFVLQRQPLPSTARDNPHILQQVVDCQALDVLVQLLMEGAEDTELGEDEAFTYLLEMVLTTVPLLDGVPECCVYRAFLIAAGLSILRLKVSQHRRCQGGKMDLFYHSAIIYVCQAPKCVLKTSSAEKERGEEHWSDVQDVWVVALENLKVLMSYIPELTDLLLKNEFIQVAAMVLKMPQESIMKEEAKQCVENVVRNLAETDREAKELLNQIGARELKR